MNLEEWLEACKKVGSVRLEYHKFMPIYVCDTCGKIVYNRRKNPHPGGNWQKINPTCTACKEEMIRAKQRDPYFEFDKIVGDPWDSVNQAMPPIEYYSDVDELVLKLEAEAREEFERESLDLHKWKNEEEWLLKQGRVREALNLMELHFNELRELL